MKPVLLIGALPPPVHGLAVMNEAVRTLFVARGHRVDVVSTETKGAAGGGPMASVRVVLRALGALLIAGATRRYARCYFTISGGWGQLREVPMIALARALRLPMAIHHHSFRYIDRPFWPSSLIFWLAGSHCEHVALGERMAAGLQARYGVARVLPISNAAFLPAVVGGGSDKGDGSTLTVVHLSNLCRAKGLYDFIALARAAAPRFASRIHFVLAGPLADAADRAAVDAACAELPSLRYIGPVYGPDKAALWRQADVFVFPTRYVNEAEPVVILEALANAVPVIAYARGEIASLIGDTGGLAVPCEAEFAAPALGLVGALAESPNALAQARSGALTRCAQLQATAAAALRAWYGRILSTPEQKTDL